jgi:hypothetical protein
MVDANLWTLAVDARFMHNALAAQEHTRRLLFGWVLIHMP